MDNPRDIGIFLPFSDTRQELQVDESNPSVCLFSEEVTIGICACFNGLV